MRVAVVTSNPDPHLNDLWSACRKAGTDVVVIGAPWVVDGERRQIEGQVQLEETDLGRGLVWRHLHGLRRTLRQVSADLVHVNGELWSVTVQETLSQAPMVVHGAENLWWHGNAVERRLRMHLVDRALRQLVGYASWNTAGEDFVLRRAPIAISSVVAPAVIPPRPFREAKWGGGSRDDEPLSVLVVGQLVPKKGCADVVRAAALTAGRRRVRLTFCGIGSQDEELRAMVREEGVEAHFLGRVTAPGLARQMMEADVLVQASRTTHEWAEQFGRAVAEAMTVGLPVLVSDSGELPHLVDQAPAAVFPEGSPEELAARLDDLQDRECLHLLASAQRPSAAKWAPHESAARMVAFWADAAARSRI